jgi:hypothetical protein
MDQATAGLLTQRAVIRFLAAFGGTQYEVRLVHAFDEQPTLTFYLVEHELRTPKYIKLFRAKNAHGYHVFVRPLHSDYVLVDDLTGGALALMEANGIRTSAEIATSPDNFQAWIRVGDRRAHPSEEEARRIARYLAHGYGGDMRSAKPSQLGRLPGFRNRKEKHRDEQGSYPLVVVRRAVFTGPQYAVVERAKSFVLRPSPPSARSASERDLSFNAITNASISTEEAREIWEETKDRVHRKFGGLPTDRSGLDYTMARSFKKHGMEREVAAKILLLNSEKANERGMQYVLQTIDKAYGTD